MILVSTQAVTAIMIFLNSCENLTVWADTIEMERSFH